MAQLQTSSHRNMGTPVKTDSSSESYGSFYRASHFVLALIPMWAGIAYLFVKDLLRTAEPGFSVASATSNLYRPLDSSIAGHLFLWVVCYFGVGFGLYIIRVITKVEENNY